MGNNPDEDFQGRADGAGGGGFNWAEEAEESLARHAPADVERRRGRPKGAKNRKTQNFADWYRERGFKDPLEAQAEFLSTPADALQAWFCERERTLKAIGKQVGLAVPALIDIVKEQMACARDLAPYLHGKAPAQEQPADERLPVLILNLGTNQLQQAQQIAGQRGLSVGMPLVIDASKNNDLAGAAVESLTGKSLTEGEGK